MCWRWRRGRNRRGSYQLSRQASPQASAVLQESLYFPKPPLSPHSLYHFLFLSSATTPPPPPTSPPSLPSSPATLPLSSMGLSYFHCSISSLYILEFVPVLVTVGHFLSSGAALFLSFFFLKCFSRKKKIVCFLKKGKKMLQCVTQTSLRQTEANFSAAFHPFVFVLCLCLWFLFSSTFPSQHLWAVSATLFLCRKKKPQQRTSRQTVAQKKQKKNVIWLFKKLGRYERAPFCVSGPLFIYLKGCTLYQFTLPHSLRHRLGGLRS